MTRLKDMTNYEFNGCVVLKRAENKGKNVCWLCRCYCGVEFVVRATDIRTGNTKSCGCLNRKLAGDSLFSSLGLMFAVGFVLALLGI